MKMLDFTLGLQYLGEGTVMEMLDFTIEVYTI